MFAQIVENERFIKKLRHLSYSLFIAACNLFAVYDRKIPIKQLKHDSECISINNHFSKLLHTSYGDKESAQDQLIIQIFITHIRKIGFQCREASTFSSSGPRLNSLHFTATELVLISFSFCTTQLDLSSLSAFIAADMPCR